MEILSTSEVAARLGVARSTVTLWLRAGKFPNAKRVGRDWAIPDTDLRGFVRPARGPKPKKGKKGRKRGAGGTGKTTGG